MAKKGGKQPYKPNKQFITAIVDELAGKTHFSKVECHNVVLASPFMEVETIDRMTFRDLMFHLFALTDDMILDRVFRAFDKDSDSWINVKDWVEGLSVFLHGKPEEQMKYCFDVYDLNNDGHISREEIFNLLKNSLVKPSNEEDPDESAKELVELALKKLDMDRDGKISFSDYKQAVEQDDTMMEYFGPCLPTPQMRMAFQKAVEKNRES